MWCFYDIDIATSVTQKVFLGVISKFIKISHVVDMNYISYKTNPWAANWPVGRIQHI
jgi:hypothetical protein